MGRALRNLLLCLAAGGCAEAVPDGADAGAGGGDLTAVGEVDGGMACDRATMVEQIRKDGPHGLEACLLVCQCEQGLANAKVSIGDFCAAPTQACSYSCQTVERGLYLEGRYCYLGPMVPSPTE